LAWNRDVGFLHSGAPHQGYIGAAIPLPFAGVYLFVKTMAREELKWQNIDADDLPTDVKQSFDAMIEAEASRLDWKSC
jgi:hypothetical protein